MTVPSSTARDQQSGNDVTTAFTVPFRILDESHIRVLLTTAAGVTTEQAITTNYTVSGVGGANTTVTFLVAPPSGTTITFLRNVTATQETDYVSNDPFPAESHERALDKLTMLLQQIMERQDRAMTLPEEVSDDVSVDLPAPAALRLLGWNAAAEALVNYTLAEIATLVAYSDKLYQVETLAAAQTDITLDTDPGSLGNLELSIDGVMQVPGTDFTYVGTTLTLASAAVGGEKVLIRYDVGLPTGITAATAVTFTPAGAGGTTRSLADKALEAPSDADYAVVGNGAANDSAALLNGLNAAAAAGRPYSLDGTKTYGISSLAIPAGALLETNGATFKDVSGTASNSPLITVAGDNTRVVGPLNIEIPTGLQRDRVLSVSGADCRFDDIDVSSVDQQANSTDNDDAAVRFSGADNVRFGRLRVHNFDQAAQFKGCEAPHGGRFDITSYTRAVHIEDTPVIRMDTGGHIRTASPNATYTPGHVGVLVSATTDDATADGVIPNLFVEDSGEHGVRVAGPGRIDGFHFPGLHTKNTGGCGMKILGTDSGTPTSRNRNITAHGAIFEDAGTGGLTSNMCGLLAMFCDGVYADNIIVRKNGKLQSGHTAVRVAACADVRITGDFGDATNDAVWLDGSLGDLDRVHVAGIARASGRDGYRLTAGTSTIRRATTDLVCDGNTGLGMNIAVGGGTMTDSLFRAKLHSNTGGSLACDSTAATLDIAGAVGTITPLSGITAGDGSTWRDTGGLLYQRIGQDWIGRGRVILGAAVANNNAVANTIQDVTGLAVAVKSGRTYRFRFVIPYSAAAATTGSRWSINGPAATFLAYRSEYSLTTTSRTVNDGLGGAYDAPAACNTDSPSTSARNLAIVEGILIPSADGTLQARFASEVAGSAITASANAYLEYEEVIN